MKLNTLSPIVPSIHAAMIKSHHVRMSQRRPSGHKPNTEVQVQPMANNKTTGFTEA